MTSSCPPIPSPAPLTPSTQRAALGPGILTCLLSLTHQCKSIRVLHCVRALANVSTNMKAKMAMAKVRRALCTTP